MFSYLQVNAPRSRTGWWYAMRPRHASFCVCMSPLSTEHVCGAYLVF